MKTRNFASIASLLGVIVLSLGTAFPAHATPLASDVDVPEEVVDSLVEFWNTGGVAESTKDVLISGMDRGIVPLSLQPDVAAISTKTSMVGVFQRTTETFKDGSIRLADVQVEPAVISDPTDFASTESRSGSTSRSSDTSITSCTATIGSGYANRDNCLVRGGSGQVVNWFYASYTLVQGQDNDQLRSTYNPGQTCTGGYTCTLPGKSNFTGQETSWTSAGATYTGTATSSVGSQTTYLTIYVGDDSAYATWVMP